MYVTPERKKHPHRHLPQRVFFQHKKRAATPFSLTGNAPGLGPAPLEIPPYGETSTEP